MKKTILSILTGTTLALGLNAQCDPSQHNSGQSMHPDSLWIHPNNLDCVISNESYSDVLYIKFPVGGSLNGISYDISSIEIDEQALAASLPTGLVAVADQSNFTWSGGVVGCVTVSGTTIVSPGSYTPVLDGSVTALAFGQTVVIDTSFTGQLALEVIAQGDVCSTDTGTTSVADLKEGYTVNVFPSPTKDVLNLQFETTMQGASVRIFNLLGEQVINEQIQSSMHTLDVRSLPNGNYFYKVLQNGNAVKAGKFIVSK